VAFLFREGKLISRRPYIPDHRRFQRIDYNLTVWCKIEDEGFLQRHFYEKEFEATTLNLSLGGMGLLSEHDIPRHTNICLTFLLFRENNPGELHWRKPLQIKGKVCYSFSTEDSRYRLGICFTEVPTEYRQELTSFLATAA